VRRTNVICNVTVTSRCELYIQGGRKNKPLRNYKKACNVIRFLCQIEVSIKHYILPVDNKYSVRDLLFDVINNAWQAK